MAPPLSIGFVHASIQLPWEHVNFVIEFMNWCQFPLNVKFHYILFPIQLDKSNGLNVNLKKHPYSFRMQALNCNDYHSIHEFVFLLQGHLNPEVLNSFAYILKMFIEGDIQIHDVFEMTAPMLPKPLHRKFEGLSETNSKSRYESFKLEGGAQALDYSSDEDFVPTPKSSPFHCDSQESSFSSISSSEGYNDLDIEFQTKPKKPKLVKKPRRPANLWSKEESARLQYYASHFGTKEWSKVAVLLNKEFGSSKTPSQCSQHYHRVASPMISKQEWTHEEDQLLMDLAKTMTRRWSKIAKSIPGRTDTQCRRRWERLISPTKTKRSQNV